MVFSLPPHFSLWCQCSVISLTMSIKYNLKQVGWLQLDL